jgi:hypothetical protein
MKQESLRWWRISKMRLIKNSYKIKIGKWILIKSGHLKYVCKVEHCYCKTGDIDSAEGEGYLLVGKNLIPTIEPLEIKDNSKFYYLNEKKDKEIFSKIALENL